MQLWYWITSLTVLLGAGIVGWVFFWLGRDRRALERAVARALRRVKRLRTRLFAARALNALRRAGRTPTLSLQFRSQFGEDSYLFDLFDEQLDGFFIEVGAYDGVTSTATYAFEALGWKGLLIEALPDRHAECAARRPGSCVIHAALSRRGSCGTATFTIVDPGEGKGRRRDMYSFLATDRSHLEEVAEPASPTSTVTVPLTTMNDVLAGHSGPIDFAVIDVEGGELDLLDGFDLARWKPRVLVVEDNTAGRDTAVYDHLANAGYALATCLGVNRIYIRRDEEALVERAKAAAVRVAGT